MIAKLFDWSWAHSLFRPSCLHGLARHFCSIAWYPEVQSLANKEMVNMCQLDTLRFAMSLETCKSLQQARAPMHVQYRMTVCSLQVHVLPHSEPKPYNKLTFPDFSRNNGVQSLLSGQGSVTAVEHRAAKEQALGWCEIHLQACQCVCRYSPLSATIYMSYVFALWD